MSNVQSEIKNQKSKIENPTASVWDQLRQSMERLGTSGRSASDPAALAAKLAHRAKMLRGRMADVKPTEAPLIFLAFNSGHERYGIPLRDVLEIQALEHFSAVPKTPPFIAGVVHWRGAILSLLDLGKLFAVKQSGLRDCHVAVIVEAVGLRIAIIAREVEEIVSVPPDQVKPAPESSSQIPPEWVLGVHDDNRLLLRMDQILQDAKFANWKKS
jgi:purine-binding chemotaxis protein CheW